jgi:hypothetical protein
MTQISSVISHAEDWPAAIWLIAYCISAAVRDQPATRDKFRVVPALLCPGWDRTRA